MASGCQPMRQPLEGRDTAAAKGAQDVLAREPFAGKAFPQQSHCTLETVVGNELAERMAGELQAESVPGRTTFSLELPA